MDTVARGQQRASTRNLPNLISGVRILAIPVVVVFLTYPEPQASFLAALIFSLEPFFAALFAYWVTGQVLTAKEWTGGILVLTGVLISELRYGSPRGHYQT